MTIFFASTRRSGLESGLGNQRKLLMLTKWIMAQDWIAGGVFPSAPGNQRVGRIESRVRPDFSRERDRRESSQCARLKFGYRLREAGSLPACGEGESLTHPAIHQEP